MTNPPQVAAHALQSDKVSIRPESITAHKSGKAFRRLEPALETETRLDSTQANPNQAATAARATTTLAAFDTGIIVDEANYHQLDLEAASVQEWGIKHWTWIKQIMCHLKAKTSKLFYIPDSLVLRALAEHWHFGH